MPQSRISNYFQAVIAKRLSSVEVNPNTSNQHEFNGTKEVRNLLGLGRLEDRPTTFLWIGDEGDEIVQRARMTWYDAREAHPTRTEWRLYYSSNDVISRARAGDLMILAKKADGELLCIITPQGEPREAQLIWLFHLDPFINIRDPYLYREFAGKDDSAIDFAASYVLEAIGVEVEGATPADELDQILQPLNSKLPATKVFSELARSTLDNISAVDDPDGALLAWMTRETELFKHLERNIIARRLEQGFIVGQSVNEDGFVIEDAPAEAYGKGNTQVDVDAFLKFSLQVQNRRKSRAGQAFEHHVEQILKDNSIKYVRGARTENKSRPDFLFPSNEAYRDANYPEACLSLLGVKTTCKDRWRQVLAEAERIERKHLLTLEPSISANQIDEMRSSKLQLVVPKDIHDTYDQIRRQDIKSVAELLEELRDKQARCQ